MRPGIISGPYFQMAGLGGMLGAAGAGAADWWSKNAPGAAPQTGTPQLAPAVNIDPTTGQAVQTGTNPIGGMGGVPGGGTPIQAGGSQVFQGGLFAGGGATGAGSAGGWNDPNVITPTAKVLAQAFQQGLTGQAAVDWASSHGAPGISYDAQRNNFGLPDGAYVAPNPTNPQTFDLISRGGGGGGGGGGGYGTGSLGGPPAAFVPPTGLDYTNDPGYKVRMRMGTDAIQAAAAAKGSALGGGTLKALERYGQDFGSNEFQNVYGRGAQTYGINLEAQRNAANDYWNRLGLLYGGGASASNSAYRPPPGA